MKVKVIKRFRDKTADLKVREVGEVLEVEEARGKMLIDRKLCELCVEEPAEETKTKKK